MNAISSVTKEVFRRYFVAALVNLGIPIDQANAFCIAGNKKRIMDFGICNTISIKIDEFMEERISDYKGFLVHENWDTIVNYNFSDD